MRILHVGKYYAPFHGGIEHFMQDLMHQQVNIGHQVSAIVHQHQKFHSTQTEFDDQIRITRVNIFGVFAFTPLAATFSANLSKLVCEFQPDIIHFHMPNPACFYALRMKQARLAKWVIHWHSDVLGDKPRMLIKALYPIYRYFERKLLKRADTVICTSPNYLTSSQALSEFKHKSVVVPLGIAERQKDVNTAISINSDQLNLLTIGRLTYYKGHKVLLDAVAQLIERSVGVSLTIVGVGEQYAELQKHVKLKGIDQHVKFAGSLNHADLMNELQQCDVFCLPSIERTEAFGVVLLEAMRAAKPCVVSNVSGSGMSWVVQDGSTGMVFSSENSSALASKLCELSRSADLRCRMGRQGLERFMSIFTINKVALAIDAQYSALLVKP